MDNTLDYVQDEILEGFRVSPQQKHLWLTAHKGLGCFSQCAILIDGETPEKRLEEALQALLERHESLRTTFRQLPGMGVPIQVIADSALVHLEVRHVEDSTEILPTIDEHLRFDTQAELNYESGPLSRYTFLKFSPTRGVLLITLSSLFADAITLTNIYTQLAAFCAEGRDKSAAAEEFVQHVDYCEWQNELLEGDGGAARRGYWKPFIDAAPVTTRLPLEPTRGDSRHQPSGIFRVATDPTLLQKLKSLAAEHGSSVSAMLLTSLSVLVWRLCEQQPFTLGCLFDGRQLRGLASALGLFARYLPVEPHIEDDYTFAEVLRRITNALSQAEARQDYFPLDHARTMQRAGLRATPLPLKFEWHQLPEQIRTGQLRFSMVRLSSRIDSYELKLACVQSVEGLELEFYYDSSVYSAESVGRLAGRFMLLLSETAKAPERLVKQAEILDFAERQQVLEGWNDTQRSYPTSVCLHELFERQAERTPDTVAVICGEQTLTFTELNARANKLARSLRKLGVRREVAVGLCLERSVEMLVAVLGIWKAGGAYVPLDAGQPTERLAFLTQDAGCRTVVTQTSLAGLLSGTEIPLITVDTVSSVFDDPSEVNLSPSATSENLAYIIYTSGSTGGPKGVMVQHGSVVNLAFALREEIYRDAGRQLTVGLNAPLAFDASVKQLIQILHGHSICIIPEDIRLDALALSGYLAKHKVDALDCTSSQLGLWLAAEPSQRMESLPETLLVGGEALDEKTWRRLAEAQGKRCFNVYGPTECTVDATIGEISGTQPTIGGPVANARVYVLDENLNPVPTGSPAQLYVGGVGLARGYLGRPELTGERFLPDPFAAEAGARMYRTGDMVRHLWDGRLEYLGRSDHQVKFQGFRIELGEIEEVLREHPAVREAAVVAVEDEQERTRLIGYVLPKRQYMKKIDGRLRHPLPHGKAIAHLNKNESEYLYQEIFEKQTYLRHGIRVPENAVVFDVGANIGMFSLFISERFPDARICAFEPLPPIFHSLRTNAELYGPNIKLFPFGVSNRNETTAFTYYPHFSVMSGQAAYTDAASDIEVIKRYLANRRAEAPGVENEPLEHADDLLSGRSAAETYECSLRRLSDVIAQEGIGQIDLLKIDVQRAEMNVLKGIRDEDWPKIQQIVMEVHDRAEGETEGRVQEIIELLDRHDFEVVAEQESLLAGTDRYNLYAIRRDFQVPPAETSPAASSNPAAASMAFATVLTTQELRVFLRERLPEYMVPASLLLLDEMPLTRNGKIDRATLSSLENLVTQSEAEYLAPQTGIEKQVATVWQQVLGVERVGLQDNFFDLGGHSLLLIQLQRRLREDFETEISVIEIFQHPTVASLAEFFKQRKTETKPEPRFKNVQERAGKMKKAVNQQKQVLKGWKARL